MAISITQIMQDAENQQSFVFKEAPFLVLLAPLLSYAVKMLSEKVEKDSILYALFERSYLEKILVREFESLFSSVINRICVYEMHVASKKGQLQGDSPEKRFDYFIQILGNKKSVISLFEKYPILKSTIEKIYSDFLDTHVEFLNRLSSDFSKLIKTFFSHEKNYQLVDIVLGGDRHNGGRCVFLLEFSNGKKAKKIVYKPRPLGVDIAFQNLLAWFNEKTQIDSFCQKIVNQSQYGWCEFIDNESCETEEEVSNFYRRMGALLCVSHLLGSSDIHAENIIAHGAYPVLIDMECTLRPVFEEQERDSDEIPRHLVSDTFLLPSRSMIRKDYHGLDLSGIAAQGGEEAPYLKMRWEKMGTDEMYLVRDKARIPVMKNLPRLQNESINPLYYEKYILEGFSEYYDIILTHKEALLAEDSPLNNFNATINRVLLRPTNIYAKLLYESYHPILLHDEQKHYFHFYWLKENTPNEKQYQSILDSEMTDLLRNNIPYFYCLADQKIIYNSQQESLPFPVKESGMNRVKNHLIHHMNPSDFRLQCAIIENSFLALKLNQVKA